jgi:hypothetical protein
LNALQSEVVLLKEQLGQLGLRPAPSPSLQPALSRHCGSTVRSTWQQ